MSLVRHIMCCGPYKSAVQGQRLALDVLLSLR